MALVARHHVDTYVIVWMILTAGMLAYFGYQQRFGRAKVWVSAVLHAAAHFGALVGLTHLFEKINVNILDLAGIWPWFFVLALEMIPTGLLVGGLIFGVFLLITCRWFNMNHNDAFSAMRLDCYRHFMRLRIKGDEVTVFPIGLDKVPGRNDWAINPAWNANNGAEPAYRASNGIKARLIERPIVVRT